jgi:tRNA dimethylallyltransferase
VNRQPLLLIVGPTGSGKTALAIEVSTRIGGEIISADSMQIYRGLDIGTAKASPAEQSRAPHHLIDILEPHQNYSAAQWAHDAQHAIDEIRSRGKTPIICGGTGFYIRALLEPQTLASAPPDEELRAQLESEAQQHGIQFLHDKLKAVDPDATARLHPNDVRRVIRAIEVAVSGQRSAVSGALYSSFILHPSSFALDWPREELYRRLENRIDAMLRAGFMDELKRLQSLQIPASATVWQSLGYRQMLPALEDESKFNECVELWKRDTRRYAKRQMTWFRHQLPTRWLPVDVSTHISELATEIVHQWHELS